MAVWLNNLAIRQSDTQPETFPKGRALAHFRHFELKKKSPVHAFCKVGTFNFI